MRLIPFWRHKKVDPLLSKILEIISGRLSVEEARRLVEYVRSCQSRSNLTPEAVLEGAQAYGIEGNEFDAIWKAVAIDGKLGTENLRRIFPMDRPDSPWDEIPGSIGEFGREATNPIPVSGLEENEVYLGRLRTAEGDPIAWHRLGSFSSDNIKGMIDKYQIRNAWTGEELGILFISPYNRYISGKAPKGFGIPAPGRNVADHAPHGGHLMGRESEVRIIIREVSGLTLPLSGGNGQSLDDAISIEVKNKERAKRIEHTVLSCIHQLGKKEWQIERTQIIEANGRHIRKISVVLSDDPDHYRNFYFDVTEYE